MKSITVSFTNRQNLTLSAKIELPPDQEPHTFALFAHCFTCNKNLLAIKNISRSLTSRGIGLMRFDFTGLGESEGEFAETNFSSNVDDLLAAADYLAEEYVAPSIMIGHSLGGAAALIAGGEIDSIQAVATIGAPSDPKHVTHLLSQGREEIEKSGEAEVNIGGRPFVIKKQFLDDLDNNHLSDLVKKLRKPLLILHSPQDKTVEIENAAELYQYAHHPKSFISLDGADHLLSNKSDSLYAGSVIGSWVQRYIEVPEKDQLKSEKQVVARVMDGLTTEIVAGKHFFVADEPERVGGNNYGPTPYEFLSTALAACTAMTIRMYANRKGWKLDEAIVHIDHNKDYVEDSAEIDQKSKKIDQFDRVIELKGDLDEAQKKRLLEIADKCPVHKTLHSEVLVRTRLTD